MRITRLCCDVLVKRRRRSQTFVKVTTFHERGVVLATNTIQGTLWKLFLS